MKISDPAHLMQTLTNTIKPDSTLKSGQSFASILDNAVRKGDEQRLYQACQDMESVLMSKVLNSMRQTITKSGWMGDSFALDTFESMLYDEYANRMSQAHTLGIADMMYRQLSDKISSPSIDSSADDEPS